MWKLVAVMSNCRTRGMEISDQHIQMYLIYKTSYLQNQNKQGRNNSPSLHRDKCNIIHLSIYPIANSDRYFKVLVISPLNTLGLIIFWS